MFWKKRYQIYLSESVTSFSKNFLIKWYKDSFFFKQTMFTCVRPTASWRFECQTFCNYTGPFEIFGEKCIYCLFRELCDATSFSFSCFLVKFLTSQLDSKRKIEEFQWSLLLAVCKSWRRHNIEEVLVFADMPSFELYICLLISLSVDIWLFASMFFWNENIF